MNFARPILSAGDRLLDRVLCVLGAVLFAQAPEFMQQYLQRLGGHLDEARRQLAQFENVARQSGLTLDRLISETSGNAESTVARLGGVMQNTVERVDALTTAQSALLHASIWNRPFVFLHHIEWDIARATSAVFKPAVPTTIEGIIYALTGILLFLGFYHLGIKLPVQRIIMRRRAAKAATMPVPLT